MWRKFPNGFVALLGLFLLFLLVMWGMRAWLAEQWRQGEVAAQEMTGQPSNRP